MAKTTDGNDMQETGAVDLHTTAMALDEFTSRVDDASSCLLRAFSTLLKAGGSPSDIQAVTEFIKSSIHRKKTEKTLDDSTCLDKILDFCTMQDVASFGQTSMSFRLKVRSYILRRLKTMLRPWVDYARMRDVMEEIGAVISGSWALAFLLGLGDEVAWSAKDVDLYVPNGNSCERLVTYLSTIEGYTEVQHYLLSGGLEQATLRQLDPEEQSEAYTFNRRGIHNVYIVKKVLKDGTCRSIDIIESIGPSAVSPIVSFDYTCVMNWIAHDSIVCLYPKLTFKKLGIDQSIKGDGHRVQSRMLKYRQRGFVHARQTEMLPGSPVCGSACIALSRSTHDIGAMIVPLTDGDGDASYDSMPRVHWELRGKEGCHHPDCNCRYETGRVVHEQMEVEPGGGMYLYQFSLPDRRCS
nr:hypothetical protein FRB93_004358 [Tulasnella sp. JGI-2019a]KAG9039459.1 hypothetical protein FRB95_010748 [Tulasnella sp. JGI-2019a]